MNCGPSPVNLATRHISIVYVAEARQIQRHLCAKVCMSIVHPLTDLSTIRPADVLTDRPTTKSHQSSRSINHAVNHQSAVTLIVNTTTTITRART